MNPNQTELEKIKQERLEILFGQNIKLEDIVIAVSDTEIEEKIKNLTELKDKLEDENKDLQSIEQMADEIDRCYMEYEEILAEMKKMRDDQLKEGVEDKCSILSEMIRDISEKVENNEQKETNLDEDIIKATELEKQLKEDLHIAKNDLAIRREAKEKRLNGGQKNYNNNPVRRR